ncbi:phosphoenolpyruvate--protein phosphotransferase [Brevundimonas intermedia]|uniref:phosphoenolpyruvate--protein phosphotransferase n=1 Tax=Brevundimonas intermedia TaxID=74315 RepID=A0ABQ5TBP4_9CAUL|nr:phosphoenolpyruvate--protein phosphotransferase [Brevundimonas intermedia]GLK49832.1 phosphoenolpyruvate--protein phosphotransferase [Brevundimonas intermedia]
MANIIITAPIQGWLTPMAAVPDPVFASGVLGDGVAIDPTGDRVLAPCDGVITSLQSAGHAIAILTDEGVEVLIHVGVDTVALGGRAFTASVAVGDRVVRNDLLITLDLDDIVQNASAAVTPVIITSAERFSISSRAAEGLVAAGAPILTLSEETSTDAAAISPDPSTSPDRAQLSVHVAMMHGIHARPAARLREATVDLEAEVALVHGERRAALTSPIAVMALGVRHGDTIVVSATGRDAERAVALVAGLIEDGMGERGEPLHPAPSVVAPVPPRTIPDDGRLVGVSAAPGRVIGVAHRLQVAEIVFTETATDPAAEHAALDAALDAVGVRLAQAKIGANADEQAILTAHAAILTDPSLVEAAVSVIKTGGSACAGWRAAIREQAAALRAGGDARMAERADDLLDLERRVLHQLTGTAETAGAPLPPDAVVVARDLLPSDVVDLARRGAVALCVEGGGPTSHAAILAATAGLPMVVALGSVLDSVTDGVCLIVNGDEGVVEPAPDDARLTQARAQIESERQRIAAARAARDVPCRTRDGVRIEAFANCGSVEDARAAVEAGAEGCGLLRTEFLFLERDTQPTVSEQTAAYQAIADTLSPRPLIIRLLDIGGDKPAPYLPIAAEENPALGLRGIRVGLAHPEVLEAQLRAILTVDSAGPLHIMAPMIASLDELRQVRAVLDRLTAELPVTSAVSLGVMVETPAAAITADLLAAEADFLSIGTNDLTQYALAMDRGNPAVAAGVDGLHPAVLRLIAEACRGAARHQTPVGVCGGLASDSLAVPLLIGLGVTELSAAPARVTAIKALVSGLDAAACRAHAAAALNCATAAEVRALARKFAA